MELKPYELVLELVRSEEAGQPFSFKPGQREYLFRQQDGTYQSAVFSWEPELLADLAALDVLEPARSVTQRLGDALRVFLEQVGWEREEHAIEEALQQGRPIHLTFRFAAAELYALPWELVTGRSTGQHLGELPSCLIRYEWPGSSSAPVQPDPPPQGGRILFAWSAAGGDVPVTPHLKALREACARAGVSFVPERDVLPNVSLPALARALAAPGERVAVLHVLCHGSGAEEGATAELAWDAEAGGGGLERVDGGALRQLLAPHASTLRLVVLAACNSGSLGLGNHLGGVALAIHRAGIEAVVASRLLLTVPGALEFTEQLYPRLLGDPCSVEQAISAVRAHQALTAKRLDWASLQLYARAADGADTRPVIFRPYVGLHAFQPHDSRFFFGREALSQQLLSHVEEGLAGWRSRFQVLAGASGSGKSSLVLAGLLPRLPDCWEVAVLRPSEGLSARGPVSGSRRMGTLARLWAELHQRSNPQGSEAPAAPGRAEVLTEARRLRAAWPEKRLLLVVDQFEEVFTQVQELEEREAFVRALWELAWTPELGIIVLATLRVDFLGRCGELLVDDHGRRLDSVVFSNEHRLFVSQVQAEDIAQLIEGPARKVGLTLEEGLVDVLRRDVEQEPGALPLLEYTLDLMWEHRQGNRLTHRAYELIGGVAGALTRTAERLYESLSAGEQLAARRLMVQLVDFRDEATLYTRRRAALTQLRPLEGQPQADFESVLGKLVASRLLLKEGDEGTGAEESGLWVQVAHEALIRTWSTLRDWIQADREALTQLRELSSWMDAWLAHRQDADKGVGYLLQGARLGYAQELQRKHGPEMAKEHADFIRASLAHQERRQRRARERTSALVLGTLLAAVVMAGLYLEAQKAGATLQVQKERADELAHHVRDSSLLMTAQALHEQDPTTAALLLLEVKDKDTDEAEATWSHEAQAVLQRPLSRAILDGHQSAVTSLAFSPDGHQLVTGTQAGRVQLRRADGTGEPVVLLEEGRPILHVEFSQNGARVLSVAEDAVRLWRWTETKGWQRARFFLDLDTVVWAAFSPDGSQVAIAEDSGDGKVLLGKVEGEAAPVVLGSHEQRVHTVAFSSNGQQVVSASADATARVWPVTGEGEPLVLSGHEGPVRSARFSPDSKSVVTAGSDCTARVWSVASASLSYTLGSPCAASSLDTELPPSKSEARKKGHTGALTTAVFSPDNQWVLTASWDHTARLWNAKGELERTFTGHESAVYTASFSHEKPSSRVLTASADATVRLWSTIVDEPPIVLRGHSLAVRSAVFSRDGRWVASASVDKTVRLWPSTPPPNSPISFLGHSGAVWSVALRQDMKYVATASQDGTVRLWSRSGALLTTLTGHHAPVRSVVFSQREPRLLLSAGQDGHARLWDVDAGKELASFMHEDWVQGADFSPDVKWVATASNDGLMRLFERGNSAAPKLTNAGHSDSLRGVAFHPRNWRRVVTASQDGTARLWDISGTGVRSTPLEGHGDWVRSAVFSPDGRRVVTASQDGTARLWEVSAEKKQLVCSLMHKPQAAVRSARFSSDGRFIVTAGADRLAHIWSVEGCVQVRVLAGHTGDVTSAVFSSDGKWILTGSTDQTARLWPIEAPPSSSELEARLRESTTACLSAELREIHMKEQEREARAAHDHCEKKLRERGNL